MGNILNILLLMAAGYIFAFFEKDKVQIEKALNKYLYYLGLPSLIIYKISGLDIHTINLNFFLINVLPVILMMSFIFILWKFSVFKSNFARALIILSTLGNTVYLGFPVINSILGEKAIGYAAIITSIHNLVIFTAGFIFINFICEDEFSLKIFLSHIFKNLIFISSIIAVLISYFSISLPSILLNFLSEISKTTLPISLFVIGVALYGSKINFNRIKEIGIVFTMKVLILPFIAAFFIYLLGESGLIFKAVFLEHTMPVAVLAFIVSKELEIDSDLSAQSILFTTIIYLLIIPFLNYPLKLF